MLRSSPNHGKARVLALRFVMVALVALSLLGAPAFAEVQWRTSADAKSPGPETASLVGVVEAAKTSTGGHIVVHFGSTVTEEDRDSLAQNGLQLLDYLGDNSYFAVVDPERFNESAISGSRSYQGFELIESEWKLHPFLATKEVPEWAVVDQKNPDDVRVAAYVMFHSDVDLATEAKRIANSYGADIKSSVRTINTLVVEMPFNNLGSLAKEDSVQYLEPALPALKPANNGIGTATGAYNLHSAPYGLDGAGINVFLYDEGWACEDEMSFGSHPDINGRVFGIENLFDEYVTVSAHAFHVAGTIAGNGATYKGMAPACSIYTAEAEPGEGSDAEHFYTNPGDLESDWGIGISWRADIFNMSVGNDPAQSGNPCDWEGDYGVTSALIDGIVIGNLALDPERVVIAAGNERGTSSCGTSYATIPPPAGSKNPVCVGATNSNDGSMTSFSSWGPTDDGRLKPDLCAPGDQVGGDNGITSCSRYGSGYTVMDGTSMAAGAVSGIMALMYQDWEAHYSGQPLNSTMKAMLIHTAQDIETVGPDYKSGYGNVDANGAIDLLRSGRFLEGDMANGGYQLLVVPIEAGQGPLKVTLVWDDVPGTPNIVPSLINDLDLVVRGPQGNIFYPYTLDPEDPSAPAMTTASDHTNNVEQIYIDDPRPGSYVVEIHGTNVAQGPQMFSVCASPSLETCSSQGVAVLDRGSYPCYGDWAEAKVIDCDLNQDDGVAETVDVSVISTSDPEGEVITLTETSPDSADFRGSVYLTAAGFLPEKVYIQPEDDIKVVYVDADDGQGNQNVVAEGIASVDCEAPTIYNVEFTEVGPRSAKIEFATDEPARATAFYGVVCGVSDGIAYGSGYSLRHSLTMTDLDDSTEYFVVVRVRDEAGNMVYDDNGGECYTFVTPEIPDFYTELFEDNDNDLSNKSMFFVPNGSSDFYAGCVDSISILPTDPAGGTVLNASDDSSLSVSLTGGETVQLYGQSYSSFYVCSNGYITFGTSDTSYGESIWQHFSKKRVAALYDDLNPGDGGTVSYKQLSDRIAVTWEEVPELTIGGANTFQIELYFDGRITISYLSLSAHDGLAGLSNGAGESPDFYETDLTDMGPCGPRPPSAASTTVEMEIDEQTSITLVAADDGLPNPPADITYHIHTLPMFDLQDIGNDHVIREADLPYELVNGGRHLLYTPTGGYLGYDSFIFYADDGGVPPEGGSSNMATVTLEIGDVTPTYFTQLFSSGLDLDNWTMEFVPDGGIDFYDACGYDITALPTDPAGGTTLNMTDDGSIAVSPPQPVYLYGQAYSTVYVGGNGYLTFTSSDTDYSESLEDHFDTPRISMLFDDLDAGDGGSISYKDIGDRFVITYMNIPHHSSGGSNTFQVELFYDGAIHISYLSLSLSAGLAGLSQGVGLPDDYEETDLSGLGACGDRPPSALDLALQTPIGDPLDFELAGADDGLPDPPAAFEYIVTSLPERGSLTDLDLGHIIQSAELPYTIADNSGMLRFTPTGGNGLVSFQYKANDGGVAPDGGDSRTATVSITIGGPQAVHSFPLEDDPGWTTTGSWAFGQPSGGGSHNYDPDSGYTGRNVYGYNLSGDYTSNMSEMPLTTLPLDCTGATDCELRFWRWLGVESSSYDHAALLVSNDESNWIQLWNHSGSAVSESSWNEHTYDISGTADGRERVYIRWTMGPTDNTVTYPGWNIDDIEIWGVVESQEPECAQYDLDDSGFVGTGDINLIKANYGAVTPETQAYDLDDSGFVGTGDINLIKANYGPCP